MCIGDEKVNDDFFIPTISDDKWKELPDVEWISPMMYRVKSKTKKKFHTVTKDKNGYNCSCDGNFCFGNTNTHILSVISLLQEIDEIQMNILNLLNEHYETGLENDTSRIILLYWKHIDKVENIDTALEKHKNKTLTKYSTIGRTFRAMRKNRPYTKHVRVMPIFLNDDQKEMNEQKDEQFKEVAIIMKTDDNTARNF